MTNQDNQHDQDVQADEETTFVHHLIELRDRLLRMVLSVIVIFVALFYFANDLYTYLAGPLMRYMPEGSQMIAIDVASPFLTPFKLTMYTSIFLAIPYILYQLWHFVAPGLYEHERKMAAPLVIASSALFYSGMAFAYYVVFPLVFGFLTGTAPEGVSVMTDITRYLDFVITIFFAFGIAFQVPIATILVVWTGMSTPEKLVTKRPFVIVGAFVVGMLLTPPDFISQTLLAVPMWVLFELGIIFSRFYVPKRDEEEDEEESDTEDDNRIASPAVVAAVSTATEDDNDDADADIEEDANESGHQEYEPFDDPDFQQLSEEEMDDEIDRIETEMDAMEDEDDNDQDDSASGKDKNT